MHEIVKIDFNGNNIIAFEAEDKIYVSVQQACEAIGLDACSQYKKIDHDPIYAPGLKSREFTTLFGNRETRFLERKFFHKWLNSIPKSPTRPCNADRL